MAEEKSLLFKHFKKKTYRQLLNEALEMVPENIDKREGSIIFDALAPACYEMANIYDDLFNLLTETYALTASKPYLDLRCAERGIFRLEALASRRKIYFSKETSPGIYTPVTDIKVRSEEQQGLLLTTTNLKPNFTFEIIEKYKTPSSKQARVKKELDESSIIAEATNNYVGRDGNNLAFSINLTEDEQHYIIRSYYEKTILFEQILNLDDDLSNIKSNAAIKFEGEGKIFLISKTNLANGEDKGEEKDGFYVGEASIKGELGNSYNGKIIPLENLYDAVADLKEVTSYGREEETDDSLRERYFDFLKKEAFGGNIAQYREWLLNVDEKYDAPPGIKGVQVYPVWNGGGTVKIVFCCDENREIPGDELIIDVKEFLDPEIHTQQGLGIAPIGHKVTVEKPEETKIHFKIPIYFVEGSISTFQGLVEEEIEKYLLNIRKRWDQLNYRDNKYNVEILHAEIVSIILGIEGILDVKDAELMMSKDKVSWTNTNLKLEENAHKQELPFKGEVQLIKLNLT